MQLGAAAAHPYSKPSEIRTRKSFQTGLANGSMTKSQKTKRAALYVRVSTVEKQTAVRAASRSCGCG
jgi:hypothetical protein